MYMPINPYRSPKVECGCNTHIGAPLMTWGKGIAIVVATTVLGAIVGTALGFTLGRFVPAYYRSVFSRGNSPDFDPMAVGIGLGLSQGTAVGVFGGLVLVGAIAWFKSRRSRVEALVED
jgi:hypothetical protein